ncbi:MAG TPA: heme exporter protein CcmD [Cellvibrionaceae bacterium]
MGTHGAYVWSCYFLMLVVLLALVITPHFRAQQLKKISRSRKSTVKTSPSSGSGSDHASAA